MPVLVLFGGGWYGHRPPSESSQLSQLLALSGLRVRGNLVHSKRAIISEAACLYAPAYQETLATACHRAIIRKGRLKRLKHLTGYPS
jgi:hypothetical protein